MKDGCGMSLVTVPPAPKHAVPKATEPQSDLDQKTQSKLICPNPACGYTDNLENETECLRCSYPLDITQERNSERVPVGTMREATFIVRFPFGELSIEDTLRVGRESSFSPIAEKLVNYDKISRVHAELTVTNGHLIVTDLNSTNGVFINGQNIPVNIRFNR